MRALAFFVLLAGCWTNSSMPPPSQASEPRASQSAPRRVLPPPRERTPEEQALQAMEDFLDRMCECGDMACAVQVSNDMTAWSQEFSRTRPDPAVRLDEAQTKRAADIGMQMGECMQRAVVPPAAPASPPPPASPPSP